MKFKLIIWFKNCFFSEASGATALLPSNFLYSDDSGLEHITNLELEDTV